MADAATRRSGDPHTLALRGLQGSGHHRDRDRAAVRRLRARRPVERLADVAAGMLPFAAVLAVAGLGQMLVVSRAASTCRSPARCRWPSSSSPTCRTGQRQAAPGGRCSRSASRSSPGCVNGLLIGGLGLNPIIATLGTNALLYAVVLGISGGRPAHDHPTCWPRSPADRRSGIPNSVFFALAALVVVTVLVQAHGAGPPVRGGRRQPPGRPRRSACGCSVHRAARLRLGPAALLPRRPDARRHHRPADARSRATATC